MHELILEFIFFKWFVNLGPAGHCLYYLVKVVLIIVFLKHFVQSQASCLAPTATFMLTSANTILGLASSLA